MRAAGAPALPTPRRSGAAVAQPVDKMSHRKAHPSAPSDPGLWPLMVGVALACPLPTTPLRNARRALLLCHPGTFGTSGSLAARRGATLVLPACKDARGVPLTQEELQAWLPVCTCAICTGRSQRKWLAKEEKTSGPSADDGDRRGSSVHALLVEAPAAADRKGRRPSMTRALFGGKRGSGTQEVFVCEAVANQVRLAV